MSKDCLVYCHCAFAKVLPPETKEAVLRQLTESGVDVEAVPDLCRMSAESDPALRRIAASGAVKIAACYPRAVRWLFAAAGAPLAEDAEVLNMRVRGADDVSAAMLDGHTPAAPAAATSASPRRIASLEELNSAAAGGSWLPWFPVIDFDRCTNCMQCLSFCLFGVYGVSTDSKIQVQNQQQCKTNCPACSRVCPEAAIMFPKYKNGPVNGDEVSGEGAGREVVKVDISSLLGGDIYQSLRNRSTQARERFSKERDESVALQERRKCLVELQKDLDIPMEVLMSLPSQDEIKRRAAEAQERARVSLENRLRDRDGLPAG